MLGTHRKWQNCICVFWNLMSNKNSWSVSNVQQATTEPARGITRPEHMSNWNMFTIYSFTCESVQPWPIMSSTGCGRRGRRRAMAWRALLSRGSRWIWWRMRRRRGRGDRWGPCTAQLGFPLASATAPLRYFWHPGVRWWDDHITTQNGSLLCSYIFSVPKNRKELLSSWITERA